MLNSTIKYLKFTAKCHNEINFLIFTVDIYIECLSIANVRYSEISNELNIYHYSFVDMFINCYAKI